MIRIVSRGLVVATALLLAACATQPARPPVPVDPQQVRQDAARRAAITGWTLSGRVAISGGRQAGSGRLDWRQRDGRYTIALSAPVTRQGWRLSGDASRARLEGIEGGPRESDDVEALLLAATGWDIPVRALVEWVRGVAASGEHGDVQVVQGANGLPASLVQAGWRIDYRDWHPAAGDVPALPRRIEAVRGDARVRLIVDAWSEVTGDPEAAADDAPASPADQLSRTLAGLGEPEADMRARVAQGDLRPVGVCGFACLASGFDAAGGEPPRGDGLRILDGTGDVVRGDEHLALKHRVEAYARAYNIALSRWLAAQRPADPSGN